MVAPMKHSDKKPRAFDKSQLRHISERTIGHYDREANNFRDGTQNHDVSQNYEAFLEAIESSKEYFAGDELAANVFVTKYAITDRDGNLHEKNPDEMHHRLAGEFARIEQNYPNPMSEKEI